jgi:hypothetical protein
MVILNKIKNNRINLIFIVSVVVCFKLIFFDKHKHILVYDKKDFLYFNYKNHYINNRLIKGNISKQLEDHLNNFPSLSKMDYIISPYDKYILFLFDESNGFDSVDLIAWLDDNKKQSLLLKKINNSENSVDILIDENIFNFNHSYGIKNKFINEEYSYPSKIQLKNKIRASEIAYYIIKNCELNKSKSAGNWKYYICN